MNVSDSRDQNIDTDELVRLLAGVPLLAGLPQAELLHLATSLHIRRFSKDEVLFREGDSGDCFYILRTGQVEVVKSLGQTGEAVLAQRGPGDFIGEMSLLNRDGLRTASIRALEEVSLWELSRQDFDALLHRRPLLAYEMVRVLSARLTTAHNNAVRDLLAKNRQLTEAYESLKAAQAQLIEKERLERELQVAYEIQMSILPDKLPQLPGFNFGARLIPARSVGGDFYGFVPLEDDRLGVMIGDVTDKGVPAAIFMAQVHAYITAEAERGETPRQVLLRVNRRLIQKGEQGLIVTAIYGVLDCKARQFAYARAGHDLPIIHNVGEDAVLVDYGTGQALGFLEEPLLDERVVSLSPGSSLLLYTDGITDQREVGGDFFGVPRLLQTIEANAGLPAQVMCDRLLETVQGFLSDGPQDDDLTLLVIQADAEG
jgi:sigma-B regulation protein RsbU (phosphoserine phosphatase)